MIHLYDEKDLNKIGLNRDDLKKTFIEKYCLESSFIFLCSGRIRQFFQYFLFGMISFPFLMLTKIKTYLIFILFWLFPLFWLVGNIYRKFIK